MADSSLARPEFPIEAAEDILVHLGVKDLLRYKSVSRSWLALINTSRFIHKHLLAQKSKSEIKIIATTNDTFDQDEFLEIYSLSLDGREPQIFTHHPNAGVVGSCNGLLCVLSEPDRKHLSVWNPLIREPLRTCYIKDTNVKSIGFGYDETTGDYKVVKISSVKTSSYIEKPYVVDVWSMRTHGWRRLEDEGSSTDARWNKVQSSFPWCVQGDHIGSCLFVGRNLYWFVWPRSYANDDMGVVSFDMGDETFRLMGIPGDIPDKNGHTDITLVDFKGSLALWIYVGARRDSNLFDLWVVGDDEVWTRLFRIGPFRLGWGFPTGVCIDGNFVFRFADECVLHDPRTKQETEIWAPPFYDRPRDEYGYVDSSCWSFVESLVRVTL